jgi:hypothetical protein
MNMSMIERIERDEANVKVERLSGGGVKISPLSPSDSSFEHFQFVAESAITEAYATGRHVVPHKSSSRGGYDVVVIGPNE